MKLRLLATLFATFLPALATISCRTTDMPTVETTHPTTAGLLVIENATIFSPSGPARGQTIVVRDGRIESAGAAGVSTRGARVIDGRGLTVLPGLIDSHAHVVGLGQALAVVSLVGTGSLDEVVERVRERAAEEEDEWVLGRGWDQNDWDVQEFPTSAALDAALPGRPVWLVRIDGHAGYASSEAMRRAGIDRNTPDPSGGEIIRDAAGNPTGVLIDNAMRLVSRMIPPPSREARKERLLHAAETIASLGITEVHEAGVGDDSLELYRELIDEGHFPIRIYAMLADDAALLGRWFDRGPELGYGGKLTVRSVKTYVDGALGSRGAALKEPYSDSPGSRGLFVSEPKHIEDVARRARAAGFQVNAHAIGDRGVAAVLEAFENAGVTPADRFRIEHLQVVDLADFPRLGALGIIAAMQPTHATSDMYWAGDRLGAERVKGAYAWRKAMSAGMPLAFGSDFPVEEVNPFLGIHAGVTRQDRKNWPEGGWQPEERLTLDETIRAFTEGAAFAAFEESTRGKIAPGMLADLTIVEGDLFALDPAQLDDVTVRYTIVGGDVVYEKQ
jgi:predicted amidohydrolase YtcJ